MFLWPASTLSWPLLLVATLTVLADVRPALAFTYTPVAEPLVVKSPFLSTWNSGSQPLAGSWAFNAADLKITAWEGLARVDGVTYNFVGDGYAMIRSLIRMLGHTKLSQVERHCPHRQTRPCPVYKCSSVNSGHCPND